MPNKILFQAYNLPVNTRHAHIRVQKEPLEDNKVLPHKMLNRVKLDSYEVISNILCTKTIAPLFPIFGQSIIEQLFQCKRLGHKGSYFCLPI